MTQEPGRARERREGGEIDRQADRLRQTDRGKEAEVKTERETERERYI